MKKKTYITPEQSLFRPELRFTLLGASGTGETNTDGATKGYDTPGDPADGEPASVKGQTWETDW